MCHCGNCVPMFASSEFVYHNNIIVVPSGPTYQIYLTTALFPSHPPIYQSICPVSSRVGGARSGRCHCCDAVKEIQKWSLRGDWPDIDEDAYLLWATFVTVHIHNARSFKPVFGGETRIWAGRCTANVNTVTSPNWVKCHVVIKGQSSLITASKVQCSVALSHSIKTNGLWHGHLSVFVHMDCVCIRSRGHYRDISSLVCELYCMYWFLKMR